MSRFLVDTSVWSLAYRRDSPPDVPRVGVLRSALLDGEHVVMAAMVLVELVRGFIPARAQNAS